VTGQALSCYFLIIGAKDFSPLHPVSFTSLFTLFINQHLVSQFPVPSFFALIPGPSPKGDGCPSLRNNAIAFSSFQLPA
jgi:hypothetical protein